MNVLGMFMAIFGMLYYNKNCHYTGEWLFDLDQLLKSMDFENTCENFRLFLTSSDSSEFPLELIQNSIKIVEEPPDSLGRNLLRIYNNPPLIGSCSLYATFTLCSSSGDKVAKEQDISKIDRVFYNKGL
ncbi:hypothetical protein HUJ05_011697 [Dendroctonus ponderosae]|nr:hypothetical protein HUJ05_011697 [Dendroctonus ponderosae]